MSAVVEKAGSFKGLDGTEDAVTGYILQGMLKLNAWNRPLNTKLRALGVKKKKKKVQTCADSLDSLFSLL